MDSLLDKEVRARLRELSDATADRGPGPRVEAALMRAFAQAHAARPAAATPPVPWLRAIAACGALAVLVGALVLQVRNLPRHTAPSSTVDATALPDGFVEVPGAASLPRLESARIVRYELPIASLPAYGLSIASSASSQAVEADLLIGQDGYTRAIRIH